ncbi:MULTISPECIES: acyl-CoA synthetase [Nocardioides]|uniref:Acyl-CoA synthetase n=1 Tax=Nocardioides vastitatis TaxID=2568655 RepID=A0ABW0ZAP9_9ACTN|nr:acyl-CoA synthetase [Nocardioides sp.]THJ08611.1 acyl-CoA synthetase [Nocardioides sp.]
MNEDLLWPAYRTPTDLASVEATALEERGLPASTYELLVRAARLWPEKTAVTVLPDAARWRQPIHCSFSELLAQVHRTANLLHGLGVRRHDAVALMAPNCHGLLVATLAAQLAGVAAPINSALSPEHIGELLDRSGARILIASGPELDESTWENTQKLAASGAVDGLLVLRPTDAPTPAPTLPDLPGVKVAYASGTADADDGAVFVGVPPASDDLAALFHTGGTTGTPKLAAHTHGNEVANAWMIAANELLSEDSVVFAGLPLFHVNALLVTLLAPLFKGQTVVWTGPQGYREPALYGAFWEIVEHYKVSAMSAVPTVYAVLSGCPVNADLSSLQFAMVGASPLPTAVRENFQAHTGVPLVEGYGLTEATCATARSFPDHPRPGEVGQRMPYQQVKVVRIGPDGCWQDLPPGQVGVLAISGPSVFPGYVVGRTDGGHALDGLGKLVDGWLDTGDLARVDADGFIHLVGRGKDLIIRGGHNIDPAVIEDALLSHPDVAAASAVGRPDRHAGEVPVAYVALHPCASATEDQLLAWSADEITERAAVPKAVVVRDTLPVTDVGKPYKLALRAEAARDVVLGELHGLAGIRSVDTVVEDGSVTILVGVTDPGVEAAVGALLGQYTLTWRVVRRKE